MNKSVAVIVGFTEGKWHRRQLENALERRGYTVVRNVEQADAIIAHSGGCYNITLKRRPEQLVVLINPTYWPGRSLHARSQDMTLQLIHAATRRGQRPLWHAYKTLHNIGYSLWHASKNLAMLRHAPHYSLPEELRHDRTILVRNTEDPWLMPNFRELRKHNAHVHFVELSGEHDDCWLNPDRYIDLLELELRSTT